MPVTGPGVRPCAGALVALVACWIVFALPGLSASWRWAPAEALLAPCLLVLLSRGRRGRAAALALSCVLTGLMMLKLADIATQAAYGRSFNPLADTELPSAAARLLSGSLGLPPIAVGLVAFCALPLATAVLIFTALRSLQAWLRGRSRRMVLPSTALAVAILALAPGDVRALVLRGDELVRFRAELRAFDAELAAPPPAHTDLAALRGADIVLIFLESYGRTSFVDRLYARAHGPIRAAAQARLAAEGLASLSGWLAAPVAGGQSWLAHATLLAGVRVPDQIRYRRLLATGRPTLAHTARAAGYHTAAYMPAITLDWPEGLALGFDTIVPADGFGYRGPSFNWVTIPDQFTLQAVERLSAATPGPRFSQIALISSHAPFTPVPPVLDAAAVGDGTVYDTVVATGESPASLWGDPARVRSAYGAALGYALTVALDHARARALAGDLVILVGDHPPARFISGIDSPDVPIHLIGRPELLALFSEWGWASGLEPASAAWPMERFRDRFVEAASVPQD